MPAKNWRFLINLIVVLGTVAYVLSLFKPLLLNSPTTPAGGDSASQFYTSWLFRHQLLPNWRISGWCAGQYAGYPILQYYFPLPFAFISLLSLAVPIEVAYKWVSVLGPALLPVSSFFFLRWMGVKFPGPAAGSVLSLCFLFNTGNSVWGGNIPSMLAGEISYCLSFSVSLLFLGSLYKGVQEQGRLRLNAVLLAVVGLSHACTLIYAGCMGFFFLLNRANFRRNFLYLMKMWIWAFLLIGVWIIPLLAHLEYTIPFNFVWRIESWRDALPVILWPPILAGSLYLLIRLLRKSVSSAEAFLGFGVGLAVVLYLVGYELHVPDIRFVPYAQFLLVLSAGFILGWASAYIRGSGILALLVLLGGVYWADRYASYIPHWINWNYSGIEAKSTWPQLKTLIQSVAGGVDDPRVAYENSPSTNRFGTMRIFELLSYFSGRSTLEGLHIQDSISAPFVYLIQAEISKDASHPVPGYYYPYQNLRAGVQHLKVFNTRYLILVSEMMKKEAAMMPELSLKKSVPPYEIYELLKNDGQYVIPLKNEPVIFLDPEWKQNSYNWFRRVDLLDVPLIFKASNSRDRPELSSLAQTASISDLPRRPYRDSVNVKSEVRNSEIVIETSKIGHPLLVKVSYHPKWKVEGADRIYLASPSFMLIFPSERRVRLYFDRTLADYMGLFATCLALLLLFWGVRIAGWDPPIALGWVPPRRALQGLVLLGFVSAGAIGWNAWNRPQKIESRAMAYYDDKQFEKAIPQFERLSRRYPQSGIAYRAHFFAAMCEAQLGRSEKAQSHWDQLVRDFPDGFYAAEGFYRQWETYVKSGQKTLAADAARQLLERYPNNYWAGRLRAHRAKSG